MKSNKVDNSEGTKKPKLLTSQDIDYIHRVLERDFCSREEVCSNLNDMHLRQKLFDKEALYLPMILNSEKLNISTYFYYFLLCRRVMVQAGLKDPGLVDTIAGSLIDMYRLHCKGIEDQKLNTECRYPPMDMRVLIKTKPYWHTVHIRARIGEYKLVFDGYINPSRHTQDAEQLSDKDVTL